MIILFGSILAVIVLGVIYFRQFHSTFSKYGVKHVTPLPLVGNMARLYLGLDHFADHIMKLYNKFPKERFIGRFEFINELVIIRDLDLVEQIAFKDCEYFNHRSILSESKSVFARNLLGLNGQEWKDMRTILSKAFTSCKIRMMVPFIVEVGENMIAMLKGKMKESKTDEINVDCEDLTSCYASDAITSCIFGLKINSYINPENPFYVRGRESITLGFRKMVIYFLMINVPLLAKIFEWDILSKRCREFFRNVVLEMIKDREIKQIVRPDMIHFLMEAKKGKLAESTTKSNEVGQEGVLAKEDKCLIQKKETTMVLTDDDIIAQVLLFFIEGFGTVSTLMNFLLYELAVNTDVQDRLAEEIKEHDAKNGGKLDYESLKNMTYLQMVTLEVLRLWHPSMILDRQCNRNYNLGKPNENAEKDFVVKKGTMITIPIHAIHRDPQYFPEPDKFDPERFSAENKHNIHRFAYFPFGVGERNCIGYKLGLCEMKAITYQILLNMEVLPTETTCIPAKLCPNSFSLKLQGGHTLRFRLRS